MKKNEFNELFRTHVRDHLSPNELEREFVSIIYKSVQKVLGTLNCLQIGSFPRFTAITPLHDLDVLYILGTWDVSASDPSNALRELENKLVNEYSNPTEYNLGIKRQTHSISLTFTKKEGGEEIFSVDIVPAYIYEKNEFGDDMYVVPEIAIKSRAARKRISEEVSKGLHKMEWIKSDPRGYISVATHINQYNDDFRKTVKLVKGWRSFCKNIEDGFSLKSFHLEQAITRDFLDDPDLKIFDAVFKFFYDIPRLIHHAQIQDRADAAKNIDAYVDSMKTEEKNLIIKARDAFLRNLEDFNERDEVVDLLNAGLYERACPAEKYIFDQGIPMLTEKKFKITGKVLKRNGFRDGVLDSLGFVRIDRKIEFRLGNDAPEADLYKWKVKNDDNCGQPRGEITDHKTLRDPEETKFKGEHFVECFAIKDGVCIGRSRQNVVLKGAFAMDASASKEKNS